LTSGGTSFSELAKIINDCTGQLLVEAKCIVAHSTKNFGMAAYPAVPMQGSSSFSAGLEILFDSLRHHFNPGLALIAKNQQRCNQMRFAIIQYSKM